jgi:hypothetical protein
MTQVKLERHYNLLNLPRAGDIDDRTSAYPAMHIITFFDMLHAIVKYLFAMSTSTFLKKCGRFGIILRMKKGVLGFDAWYSAAYGARWPALKAALLAPRAHVAVYNPYTHVTPAGTTSCVPGITFSHAIATHWPSPSVTAQGLMNYYLLDAASILPVEALAIQPGERVVDLCAAPGGKSLLCAYKLNGHGVLIANDRSSTRRLRIQRIMEEYLPESVRQMVQITGHDATRWSLHARDCYDKVLLDAPCSSERHLLEHPNELAQWAPGRTKSLAVTQFAMLASALDIVKVGGRIVYSTCALSTLENDDVIAKLHKKRPGRFQLEHPTFAIGTETRYGWQVLPDSDGWGPFYVAVIQRTA